MAKTISDSVPDSEAKELLRKIQDKVEKCILEEFPGATKEDDNLPITFMISVKHDETGISVWVGNGCPACAIVRAIQWGVENRITHEDGEPLVMPIQLGQMKTKKKDIH